MKDSSTSGTQAMSRPLQRFLRATLCMLCGIAVWAVMAAAVAVGPQPDSPEQARERMVREDIAAGGVCDPRVLESMRTTLRHEFVPSSQRSLAYYDMALPIGESQTISGAFVVAYMPEKLEPQPTDRVLEIGTGSGYQAAVLSPLVETVYSIEINRPLGEKAARTLNRLGYRNVITKVNDGFLGWPEHAPFDKIIVTCSPENIPKPLIEQLAEGGRMIIPVGERFEQTLVLLSKRNGEMIKESLLPSLFVPMTGAAEDARQRQPDGTHPALHNGGFVEVLPDSQIPTAWYYGRQMELAEGDDAQQGTRYLRLENSQPGRPAQVFQGFPIDGKIIGRLKIELSARSEGIREGLTADAVPAIVVRFFDQQRSRSAQAHVGPWRGTFAWKRVDGVVSVPSWAREAILQIGMLGATGRFEVDDVRIDPIGR